MLYSKTKATGVGGVNVKDILPQRRLWIFEPGLLSLNLLLLGVLVSDITNGYDNSLLNGLQLLDSWQDYFGSPEGAWLGLIATSNRLGAIAAVPFISPLMTRMGRRWPIVIGSSITLCELSDLAVLIDMTADSRGYRRCYTPSLIPERSYVHRWPSSAGLWQPDSNLHQPCIDL
jgi:MFS family permease